jgi:uncharacterized MAPEG superfamily protein
MDGIGNLEAIADEQATELAVLKSASSFDLGAAGSTSASASLPTASAYLILHSLYIILYIYNFIMFKTLLVQLL